jgi:hypothetical protein
MNMLVPFTGASFNNRTTKELRQGIVDEAIKQHRQGRIITLMWHCCFPELGDDCDGSNHAFASSPKVFAASISEPRSPMMWQLIPDCWALIVAARATSGPIPDGHPMVTAIGLE